MYSIQKRPSIWSLKGYQEDRGLVYNPITHTNFNRFFPLWQSQVSRSSFNTRLDLITICWRCSMRHTWKSMWLCPECISADSGVTGGRTCPWPRWSSPRSGGDQHRQHRTVRKLGMRMKRTIRELRANENNKSGEAADDSSVLQAH